MTTIVVLAALAYLLAGLYMATKGPLGWYRRMGLVNIKMDAIFETISEWRKFLKAVVVWARLILGWPILYPRHLLRRGAAQIELDRRGLWFKELSGAGTFRCRASQPRADRIHPWA